MFWGPLGVGVKCWGHRWISIEIYIYMLHYCYWCCCSGAGVVPPGTVSEATCEVMPLNATCMSPCSELGHRQPKIWDWRLPAISPTHWASSGRASWEQRESVFSTAASDRSLLTSPHGSGSCGQAALTSFHLSLSTSILLHAEAGEIPPKHKRHEAAALTAFTDAHLPLA